ncbi:hypothetical protein CAPTEDRAFT_222964 [Capitella teleta]|uniref:Uncharacterized protein n=1 Tax=Capitella teleta TaxID=283909 RepID=X2ATT5_CAPTE|nr:hypothetical protein CAPTEDRAFT_222964 [Capitella teleta]|eukprot:ELU04700.1 hypothetical protein CAPTEDRAFT_222964 [Capitella teleta]
MCRSGRQSLETYKRAKSRLMEWPAAKNPKHPSFQEPAEFTSVDDAFASLLHSLSTASRQCKKYYHSSPEHSFNASDELHCRRFHGQSHSRSTNPLEMTEDVHLIVDPGSYAISAKQWTEHPSSKQTTHIVHLDPGHCVVQFSKATPVQSSLDGRGWGHAAWELPASCQGNASEDAGRKLAYRAEENEQMRHARVIGGQVSSHGEWPWLAALGLHSKGQECGGSLFESM